VDSAKELFMSWTRVRWAAFATLCGGTLFQATGGCEAILAPVVSSVATSVVTGFISSLFLAT
jgi:hypothetical protein